MNVLEGDVMKIRGFRIENFKNIKLAEYDNLPDFVVICGGNGSGKSAILEALMMAKEVLGSYGYFQHNPSAVSADSSKSTIYLKMQFTDEEIKYLKEVEPNNLVTNEFYATVQILRDGTTSIVNQSPGNIYRLFTRFSEQTSFFDYFSAHRDNNKSQLNSWQPDFLNENNIKQILSQGQNKYQYIKQYLASLKMKDLQGIQQSLREDKDINFDSLQEIRSFFNEFFSPMEFDDVYLDKNPFQFLVKTPRGKIDIDELSSGEKEILNTFIHFHQLKPENSIILFDEPDVHLHPELERKYLSVLRKLGENNQFFITTHSPEMMIEAGNDALFTIIKYQNDLNENQFVKVSNNSEIHSVLSNIMGSKGFVSLNRKVIFIEGEYSSTDIQLFEKLYPNNIYNITFIPSGNSTTVTNISEKVNYLLQNGTTFQQYYCIIDGDIEREGDTSIYSNIYKLPVYHIENFLVNEKDIFELTKAMLGNECEYSIEDEVLEDLKKIALSDEHLLPFTKALMDARVYNITKQATDLIYCNNFEQLKQLKPIDFTDIKSEAYIVIENSIKDGNWKSVCKGRDLLKGYCRINGLKYEQFRNLLIERMKIVPDGLKVIMENILSD